jgi:hypothetical protein
MLRRYSSSFVAVSAASLVRSSPLAVCSVAASFQPLVFSQLRFASSKKSAAAKKSKQSAESNDAAAVAEKKVAATTEPGKEEVKAKEPAVAAAAPTEPAAPAAAAAATGEIVQSSATPAAPLAEYDPRFSRPAPPNPEARADNVIEFVDSTPIYSATLGKATVVTKSVATRVA